MNTLNSTNTRKLLLVPVFAAIAAFAQASHAADAFGDTENRVRSVLEGARTYATSEQRSDSSRVFDVQEHARQVLLGVNGSKPNVQVVSSESSRHSSEDAQKFTQRVILGRAAS
jgi:hypothetical protein